jgi:hypothetical protein
MIKSINHPWAISDKFRSRYGEVWSNLDFVFLDKISKDLFKNDPMNLLIGYLYVNNQQIKMTYKDLLNYSKSIRTASNEAYLSGTKTEKYDVKVRSQNFSLQRHELGRLADTLDEATVSVIRAYELGLYL